MRLYCAGPMRSVPEFNHPAFNNATFLLRSMGHDVFNPAEHDVSQGFDTQGLSGDLAEAASRGFSLRMALSADLRWLTENAEGVVLLEGWEYSKGACAEVVTAQALGLPVWEFWDFWSHGLSAPQVGLEMKAVTLV